MGSKVVLGDLNVLIVNNLYLESRKKESRSKEAGKILSEM